MKVGLIYMEAQQFVKRVYCFSDILVEDRNIAM